MLLPIWAGATAPTGKTLADSLVPTHPPSLPCNRRSVKLYGPRPCLGHRPIVDGVAQPFQFLSYNEVAETVNHVGSGYTNLGLKPKDKIGVIGPNTPEWMMAMQVCDRVVGGLDQAKMLLLVVARDRSSWVAACLQEFLFDWGYRSQSLFVQARSMCKRALSHVLADCLPS